MTSGIQDWNTADGLFGTRHVTRGNVIAQGHASYVQLVFIERQQALMVKSGEGCEARARRRTKIIAAHGSSMNMTQIGTNIWPDDFAAISLAGTRGLTDDVFAKYAEFSAALSLDSADLVCQYAVDEIGFLETKVYRRYGDGEWHHLDLEEGVSYTGNPHPDSALPVLMSRDGMAGMVLLSTSAGAAPATAESLDAAPNGSIASAGPADQSPDVVIKSHGQWIDGNTGVAGAFSTAELLRAGGIVKLLWNAPEES